MKLTTNDVRRLARACESYAAACHLPGSALNDGTRWALDMRRRLTETLDTALADMEEAAAAEAPGFVLEREAS